MKAFRMWALSKISPSSVFLWVQMKRGGSKATGYENPAVALLPISPAPPTPPVLGFFWFLVSWSLQLSLLSASPHWHTLHFPASFPLSPLCLCLAHFCMFPPASPSALCLSLCGSHAPCLGLVKAVGAWVHPLRCGSHLTLPLASGAVFASVGKAVCKDSDAEPCVKRIILSRA